MNSNCVSRRVNVFSVAAALVAVLGVGFSDVAAAEPSAAVASVSTSGGGVSRAEVIADLRLWLRAGLDQYSDLAARDAAPYGYEQALAKYQAWRSGPAYGEELARARKELGAAMVSDKGYGMQKDARTK